MLPKPKFQCPKISPADIVDQDETGTNMIRERTAAVSKYNRHFDKRYVRFHIKEKYISVRYVLIFIFHSKQVCVNTYNIYLV